MDGFYAADHDVPGAYVECNFLTPVSTPKSWRTDLGSVACPFEVNVAISWMGRHERAPESIDWMVRNSPYMVNLGFLLIKHRRGGRSVAPQE
ncbi:hypothetical protein RR51_06175 [Pseudomonas sp. C5pp]|nr:hypothetical protein RR51_06175 [Pseudomonas sp. C5pp]